MKIPIAAAKAIREQLRATHLVIFAVDESGEQCVATHGQTQIHAKESAKAGNKLKRALGWPEDLCQSTPLPRQCQNCVYWKQDWGIHCFNGWSGDGSSGFCRCEPTHVKTNKDDLCIHFEPNA